MTEQELRWMEFLEQLHQFLAFAMKNSAMRNLLMTHWQNFVKSDLEAFLEDAKVDITNKP